MGVLVEDAFSDLLLDLEGVPPPPPPLAPLAGSSVSTRVARLADFWPSAPFLGLLVLEPPACATGMKRPAPRRFGFLGVLPRLRRSRDGHSPWD